MNARRRQFLQSAAAAGIAAFAGLRPLQAADAEVEINLSAPGPQINPHIYGHFIEHLGGVIYDGIWVGRDSKIANVDGIRTAVRRRHEAHRRAEPPLARRLLRRRLPLARRHRRAREAAAHLQLLGTPHARRHGTRGEQRVRRSTSSCACAGSSAPSRIWRRMSGSGTPQEFHDWVSYCNAPAGTLSLADERAANGEQEPFNVKYWGVGNESWGCGGNMTGGEYATRYRRFISQFPVYVPAVLRGHRAARALRRWRRRLDRGLLRRAAGRPRPGRQGGRLCAALLHRLPPDGRRRREVRREGLVRRPAQGRAHRGRDQPTTGQIMGKYDPEHRTKFVIDEWGNWYRGGTELGPDTSSARRSRCATPCTRR